MTIQINNAPITAANRRDGKARRRSSFFRGCPLEKNNAVIRIFTPCADPFRLLETLNLTVRSAAFGDVILFSPACSISDQFRDQPNGGEVYRNANDGLADATGSVATMADHNMQAAGKSRIDDIEVFEKKVSDLHRGFLRQNPGAKTQPNPTSNERTPTSANQP